MQKLNFLNFRIANPNTETTDLSSANLSGALLFFINLREVLNLEPLQLKAKPSPFLCNVALPNYSQQPNINPNRACGQIPQLWRDRYNISLEEAQWIVDEPLTYSTRCSIMDELNGQLTDLSLAQVPCPPQPNPLGELTIKVPESVIDPLATAIAIEFITQ